MSSISRRSKILCLTSCPDKLPAYHCHAVRRRDASGHGGDNPQAGSNEMAQVSNSRLGPASGRPRGEYQHIIICVRALTKAETNASFERRTRCRRVRGRCHRECHRANGSDSRLPTTWLFARHEGGAICESNRRRTDQTWASSDRPFMIWIDGQACPYVGSRPGLGHAYSRVPADSAARRIRETPMRAL